MKRRNGILSTEEKVILKTQTTNNLQRKITLSQPSEIIPLRRTVSSHGIRNHHDLEAFDPLVRSKFYGASNKLGLGKCKTPGCSPIRLKTP